MSSSCCFCRARCHGHNQGLRHTLLLQILLNAICPSTFFSCAMKWLYFVIRSISTLEYQFTVWRYRVSSKREKWKGRSYITGSALQSQPATGRIALQGFPPSKTSSFFPRSLCATSISEAFSTFYLKTRGHRYSHDALYLILKETWRGKAQVFLYHHTGSHLAVFQHALPLSVLTVSLHKTADPSVNHIE